MVLEGTENVRVTCAFMTWRRPAGLTLASAIKLTIGFVILPYCTTAVLNVNAFGTALLQI